jgi:hypothetical protein
MPFEFARKTSASSSPYLAPALFVIRGSFMASFSTAFARLIFASIGTLAIEASYSPSTAVTPASDGSPLLGSAVVVRPKAMALDRAASREASARSLQCEKAIRPPRNTRTPTPDVDAS